MGLPERSSHNTGMTMIELLWIIAILGILASLAIPTFAAWLPNYRLKRAARDLYSNFQLTKMGAVKQNKNWAVVFDQGVTPGRYHIVSDSGANTTWEGLAPGSDDTVEKTVDLIRYEGVDFGRGNLSSDIDGGTFSAGDDVLYGDASDPDVVVFTPRGTCLEEGYVYLANQRNTVYGIGTKTSGVVLLRKWTGSAWK